MSFHGSDVVFLGHSLYLECLSPGAEGISHGPTQFTRTEASLPENFPQKLFRTDRKFELFTQSKELALIRSGFLVIL